MKRLILVLVLMGLSGSAFAQVSCGISYLADVPCACEFAMDNLLVMSSGGATLLQTSTEHLPGGEYHATARWQCPGSSDWIEVTAQFYKVDKARLCSVGHSVSGSLCVGVGPSADFGGYTGKSYHEEKAAVKGVLSGLGGY